LKGQNVKESEFPQAQELLKSLAKAVHLVGVQQVPGGYVVQVEMKDGGHPRFEQIADIEAYIAKRKDGPGVCPQAA
jgi:hypothetical protein